MTQETDSQRNESLENYEKIGPDVKIVFGQMPTANQEGLERHYKI